MRQINLLSQDIVQELEKSKVQVSLIVCAAVILVSIFIQYLWFSYQVKKTDDKLIEYIAKERQFTFIDLERELSEIDSKIQQLKSSNQQYALFLEEDNLCIDLLNALTNITESKVWFGSLALNKASAKCKIEGFSYKPESASEFVFNLKGLPFFTSVDLGTLQKSKEEGKDIVNFDVECALRTEGPKEAIRNESFFR